MSTESVDASGTITRHDPPVGNKPSETVCDGCRELLARVERLEQQLLGDHKERAIVPVLGTTSCYWICIAAHVLCVLFFCSSTELMQFGLAMGMGAAGTMIVCHVFSTRTIPEKVLRTLLSCGIVIGSGIAVFALQGGDVLEVLPQVLVYLPFVLLDSWFVAKLFVWTRGWKIVPPGYSSEYPRLQIRHLLFCTLIVAAHLGLTRFLIDDSSKIFDAELLGAIPMVLIPISIGTVFSSLLARFLLSSRRSSVVKPIAVLVGSAFAFVLLAFSLLLSVFGGMSFDAASFIAIVFYSIMAMLGLFGSSGFTFFMMRCSGYRLLHP